MFELLKSFWLLAEKTSTVWAFSRIRSPSASIKLAERRRCTCVICREYLRLRDACSIRMGAAS